MITFNLKRAITEANYLENFCEQLLLINNREEELAIKGLPKRMVFETEIWQVGEQLRVNLRDKAKRTPILKKAVVAIITDNRYRRGRESFVMLLHLFPQDDESLALFKWLLADRDLYGFALVELNKMMIGGFRGIVDEIFRVEKTGWIRREAKKYLNRNEY